MIVVEFSLSLVCGDMLPIDTVGMKKTKNSVESKGSTS